MAHIAFTYCPRLNRRKPGSSNTNKKINKTKSKTIKTMKKFFIIFAAAISLTLTSCYDAGSKMEGFCDDYSKAKAYGDDQKAREINYESQKWYDGLSEKEKKDAEQAAEKWRKKHPELYRYMK